MKIGVEYWGAVQIKPIKGDENKLLKHQFDDCNNS